jgi:hypothetical protein
MLERAVLAATLAVMADETTLRARETAQARVPLADKIAADSELLAAIVVKNKTVESPAEILRIDQEWQKSPLYPLRKTVTGSPCAARLRRLVQDDKLVVEAFLMDSRGGIVCSTVETSDYWQGDEAKWIKPVTEHQEAYVDDPAFDDSTQAYAIQMSVPVTQGGTTIGALSLTLKVPKPTTASN